MSIGLLFWILWVIWLVFGFWSGQSIAEPNRRYAWGGHFLLLVLFFLVGWKIFGFVIRE